MCGFDSLQRRRRDCVTELLSLSFQLMTPPIVASHLSSAADGGMDMNREWALKLTHNVLKHPMLYLTPMVDKLSNSSNSTVQVA